MSVAALATDVRPPLKWAGGKRWQLPYLRPLWARHARRRLVEPFCGGLGVALGLKPERALLNDANPHLVNFYRWAQRGFRIDVDMRNEEAVFYRHRDRFNELLRLGEQDTAEAAGLFYYLNRTGYNGLCRFNAQGGFNVPFGRYARITYVRDWSAVGRAIAGWTFTSADVEAVDVEPGDFVYADPPYDVDFTQYAQGGFSWADQERTAVWAARHPGPVVLVNQATARVERLYRSLRFKIAFLDAPRRISCNGDRAFAREIVATRHV